MVLIKALSSYVMSTLVFLDAGVLSFKHVKYPFKLISFSVLHLAVHAKTICPNTPLGFK